MRRAPAPPCGVPGRASARASPILLLLLAPLLLAGDVPEGKYRPPAKPEVIEGWEKDLREKTPLVPPPPRPLPS